MRGSMKILSGLFILSTASAAFADLPSQVLPGTTKPIGKVLAYDPSTGETCLLSEGGTAKLNGALVANNKVLEHDAQELMAGLREQVAVQPCSSSVRAELEPISTQIKRGTKTAGAPLVYGAIAYYAACTAINVKVAGDSLRSAMSFGGGDGSWDAASVASVSVCLPVTGTSMVLVYLGFQALEKYENMNKKAEPAKNN